MGNKTESVGEALKQMGMRDVLAGTSKEWRQHYLHVAVNFLARNVFVTGEDIRLACERDGLAQPHHPNAWGAMFSSLSRGGREWIRLTNEWANMTDPKSHARCNRFWRSNIYRGTNTPELFVIELPE